MSDVLELAPGTLLLLLALTLSLLACSLLMQLLRMNLKRHDLTGWLNDNEPLVAVALWAALSLLAYLVGPNLLLGLIDVHALGRHG